MIIVMTPQHLLTDEQIDTLESLDLRAAVAIYITEEAAAEDLIDDPGQRFSPYDHLPSYEFDIRASFTLQTWMHKLGFWMELKSPFHGPGSKKPINDEWDGGPLWFAGFTPHATTGWNGTPDHNTWAWSPSVAIARAALNAIMERLRDTDTFCRAGRHGECMNDDCACECHRIKGGHS